MNRVRLSAAARRTWSALCVAALVLVGCERPFVEQAAPEIEVVSPDLNVVLDADEVTLRVKASSFRRVERVLVDGRAMTYRPAEDVWEATVPLGDGLNPVVLTAEDVLGITAVDTAYAVRARLSVTLAGPRLPAPVGGHTATVLADGSLLIAGGARAAEGLAVDDAYLLPPGGTRFEPLPEGLRVARTGHTATLLPDGRVLILGGSRSDRVRDVEDLVETAEVFDPSTRTFRTADLDGPPIRRTLHTAMVFETADGPVVEVYGGRGDVQYSPSPRLGIRRDLRAFRLTGLGLSALDAGPIGPTLEPVFGHTQTPLGTDPRGPSLVAGSYFIDDRVDDVSFVLDLTRDDAGFFRPLPALTTARLRHVALRGGDGFVLVQGGRQASPRETLHAPTLYVAALERFVPFPENRTTAVPRYGHTATKLDDGRILLMGGFSASGAALDATEFVTFTM